MRKKAGRGADAAKVRGIQTNTAELKKGNFLSGEEKEVGNSELEAEAIKGTGTVHEGI